MTTSTPPKNIFSRCFMGLSLLFRTLKILAPTNDISFIKTTSTYSY
jgi:hypothetical protein